MTTPDAHTVISVRGESQRIAAPDQASIYATVLATGGTKSAAASDVARVVGLVTAQLAELGGESLTALTTCRPLTWSTQSIHTTEEHAFHQASGGQARAGRHQASANLLINVRDFQVLGRVESILTTHDMVNVGSVHWSVDQDNPAWAQVRADAIRAARTRARTTQPPSRGRSSVSSTSPTRAYWAATHRIEWLTAWAAMSPWAIGERTLRHWIRCHKNSAQPSRHAQPRPSAPCRPAELAAIRLTDHDQQGKGIETRQTIHVNVSSPGNSEHIGPRTCLTVVMIGRLVS
jgi:hypothetical protein